jgi:hypothetical protein
MVLHVEEPYFSASSMQLLSNCSDAVFLHMYKSVTARLSSLCKPTSGKP